MCDFAKGCGGTGTLRCRGCGGDLCICLCGGEQACFGCEDCERGGEADAEDDDDGA